ATNLSGGERQRIAIARALVRDAPILVLDEPTTGLDAESSHLVLQGLHELMKGRTTIIISHDLHLIQKADRIVVIRQGRIEQTGGHAELLREGGLYASLHARRFGESGEQPAMVDLGAATEVDASDPRACEANEARLGPPLMGRSTRPAATTSPLDALDPSRSAPLRQEFRGIEDAFEERGA